MRQRVGLTLLIALAAVSGGCGRNPVSAPPSAAPQRGAPVDYYPAWTPTGDTLYFVRLVTSPLGPPGLYWTTWDGKNSGAVSTPAFFEPLRIRVSPDGQTIGGIHDSKLVFIDPHRGTIQTIYQSDDGVSSFDWEPGGPRVVITRPLLTRGESTDSSGLALLDPRTHAIEVMHFRGGPVYGDDLRWSPDGRWIAYQFARQLYVIRPDGSERVQLTLPTNGRVAESPRWLDHGDRLLYVDRDERTGVWHNSTVALSDRTPAIWPVRLGDAEAITPNGQQVVVYGRDPAVESVDWFVFFLTGIDDRWQTSTRQLTSLATQPSGPR